MPLIVKPKINKDTNKKIELASEDNHVAVCVGIWDMGNTATTFRETKETKILHKILIRWEIDENIQEEGEYQGKKKCVDKPYNFTFHEKSNLRRDVESWIGKLKDDVIMVGFDLETLIGQPCMLNIAHNIDEQGNKWANVMNISKLPKGLQPFITDNLETYRQQEPAFVQKRRDKYAEKLAEYMATQNRPTTEEQQDKAEF